jgi:hypothetical protein
VLVEDLSYGAVAVAQRLQELRPDVLVLVGAKERGRPAGTVERRSVTALPDDTVELQRAVADAVTGYIDLDLVLEVAHGLGALPPHTVAIEVEPASSDPATALTAAAERGLAQALRLVQEELQSVSSTPRP